MSIKQDLDIASMSTPLGADKLALTHCRGEEFVGRPFFYQVRAVSEDKNLDMSKVAGKNICLTVMLADNSKRYINAVATDCCQGFFDERICEYHFELRPWLWLLTQTRNSLIFQKMSTPDIIKKVCSDAGFSDISDKLTGSYEKREYCVQYQESDFDFISRLMEDEGIFYFFDHSDSAHTLVLADSPDAFKDAPGAGEATYRADHVDWTSGCVVTECRMGKRVQPGKFAVDDYNFETPSTDLFGQASGQGSKRRLYRYPAGFSAKDKGESLANRRLDAFESREKYLSGRSNARGFIAGKAFTLKECDCSTANAKWAITSLRVEFDQSRYSNVFEAVPVDAKYRPEQVTPWPRISGAQTALVTGKSGEEIWTDKYGRIKVQFHWDQEGKKDENSSCWVRVSQPWAGKNWGTWFLPRVGMEVVVTFLEGDPDRPLVTGAVYNAEQTLPYALPGEQTKSTIKSNSSKGGGGFNELRFEDKKDSEEIYIHAQKDWNSVVENARSVTIKEADDTLTLEKGNRTSEIQKGTETHSVKGTRTLTVEGDEKHTNKANYDVTVDGNYTLTVKGDFTLKVDGNITIQAGQAVEVKAGTSLTNKAGTELTSQAGTNMTTKAGVNMDVQASAQMNIQGSMATVKADAMGEFNAGAILTLKGAMVKIG